MDTPPGVGGCPPRFSVLTLWALLGRMVGRMIFSWILHPKRVFSTDSAFSSHSGVTETICSEKLTMAESDSTAQE